MVGTLAIAAALALQTAPAAQPGAVTLGRAAAQAGDGVRVVSVVTTKTTGTFTVGGAKLREFDVTTIDARAWEAKLAAASADARVARIEYGECTSTRSDPTGDDVQLLPCQNRKFVVERKSAATQTPASVREINEIRSEKDDKATREELADVANDEVGRQVVRQVGHDAGELLAGSGFAALLADLPLELGKPIDVPEEVARAFLGDVLPDGVVQRFTLTPKEARGDAIAFAVALGVTMKQGQGEELPVTSTFELSGELLLGRAHARVAALDLKGPIRFNGAKDESGTRIEVTGTGTLTWKYEARPSAASDRK
jgi:hypothetical protein